MFYLLEFKKIKNINNIQKKYYLKFFEIKIFHLVV